MKREFIIKLQGRQHEKGRGRLVFMLLCFVIALVILMIYSSKYFIALLAPAFYLVLRLKNLSAEKEYLTDAICTVDVHALGFELNVKSTQSKLCANHAILYSSINSFVINDRKVTIDYNVTNQENTQRRILEFHVLPNDLEFWCELSRGISRDKT